MSWQAQESGLSSLSKLVPVALLLLACVLLLSTGHAGLNAYSGKDEYYLSIRTVLSMHEQDIWLVPFLDGEPRLRKPPGLYWMGRAAIESCGISLYCLRITAVFWAFIWAVACLALARWLYPSSKDQAGLLVAAVLLSSLGFLVEGRRLMLDLPMTAASSLALWGSWKFLAPHAPTGTDRIMSRSWSQSLAWTLFSAAAMATSLLIKGPAAFLVWLTGLVFVLISFRTIREQRGSGLLFHILGVVVLGVAATLPWFFSAMTYQQEVVSIAEEEMQARRFGGLSLSPLWGLWLIASPWFLIVVYWIIQRLRSTQTMADPFEHRGLVLALGCWILASLIPFFFMRTFERYLLGSLVPIALVIPLLFSRGANAFVGIPGWVRFLSGLPIIVMIGLVQCFAIWFGLQSSVMGSLLIALVALFAVIWWRAKSFITIAIALGLWLLNVQLFISYAYPSLRINDAPMWLIDHAKTEPIVYFGGPHPAMLSAVTGRAHVHVNPERVDPIRSVATGTWIVASRSESQLLRNLAVGAGRDIQELGHWRALVNHGSAFRVVRPGASWERALSTKDLQELMTEIVVFKLVFRAS